MVAKPRQTAHRNRRCLLQLIGNRRNSVKLLSGRVWHGGTLMSCLLISFYQFSPTGERSNPLDPPPVAHSCSLAHLLTVHFRHYRFAQRPSRILLVLHSVHFCHLAFAYSSNCTDDAHTAQTTPRPTRPENTNRTSSSGTAPPCSRGEQIW